MTVKKVLGVALDDELNNSLEGMVGPGHNVVFETGDAAPYGSAVDRESSSIGSNASDGAILADVIGVLLSGKI